MENLFLRKILVAVFIAQTLFTLSYADTNGIWTYPEDIESGVFGADENNPANSNYTFNDIVYFNENIFSSANMSAHSFVSSTNSNRYVDPSGDSELESVNINDIVTIRGTDIFDLFVNRSGDTMSGNLYLGTNEVEANRFVDSQNTVYYLNPSGVSNLYRIASNRYYTNNGDNSKYLDPSRDSVINNLNVVGTLELNGVDITDAFVEEGQPNSITRNMIQNNAIDSSKISTNSVRIQELDTSSVDNRYVNRNGDRMSGDLNMNGNRITNLPTPTGNNQPATKGYVDSNSGGSNCGSREHGEAWVRRDVCSGGGYTSALKQCFDGTISTSPIGSQACGGN
jgi:hypothetical protein